MAVKNQHRTQAALTERVQVLALYLVYCVSATAARAGRISHVVPSPDHDTVTVTLHHNNSVDAVPYTATKDQGNYRYQTSSSVLPLGK